MTGYHYSTIPNLTTLKPEYHGTGLRGRERERRALWPQYYIPRLYFYDKPTLKEPELGNHLYIADLTHLYWLPIPRGCIVAEKAREIANDIYYGDGNLFFTLFENLLQYGYNGLYRPHTGVIAYFREMEVLP